jgi:hypothetical protein
MARMIDQLKDATNDVNARHGLRQASLHELVQKTNFNIVAKQIVTGPFATQTLPYGTSWDGKLGEYRNHRREVGFLLQDSDYRYAVVLTATQILHIYDTDPKYDTDPVRIPDAAIRGQTPLYQLKVRPADGTDKQKPQMPGTANIYLTGGPR